MYCICMLLESFVPKGASGSCMQEPLPHVRKVASKDGMLVCYVNTYTIHTHILFYYDVT